MGLYWYLHFALTFTVYEPWSWFLSVMSVIIVMFWDSFIDTSCRMFFKMNIIFTTSGSPKEKAPTLEYLHNCPSKQRNIHSFKVTWEFSTSCLIHILHIHNHNVSNIVILFHHHSGCLLCIYTNCMSVHPERGIPPHLLFLMFLTFFLFFQSQSSKDKGTFVFLWDLQFVQAATWLKHGMVLSV